MDMSGQPMMYQPPYGEDPTNSTLQALLLRRQLCREERRASGRGKVGREERLVCKARTHTPMHSHTVYPAGFPGMMGPVPAGADPGGVLPGSATASAGDGAGFSERCKRERRERGGKRE